MCFKLYFQALFLLSRQPRITHSTIDSHAYLKRSAEAILFADVPSVTICYGYTYHHDACLHVLTIKRTVTKLQWQQWSRPGCNFWLAESTTGMTNVFFFFGFLGVGGMVLSIDETFLFREKKGVPLIIFFKILGVPHKHQSFRRRPSTEFWILKNRILLITT